MTVDVVRAGGDESRVRLFGDVVVVAVEAASGDVVGIGERVQFVEIGIADQVRPQSAVRRPARIVDQYGHVAMLPTEPPRAAGHDPGSTAFAPGRAIR